MIPSIRDASRASVYERLKSQYQQLGFLAYLYLLRELEEEERYEECAIIMRVLKTYEAEMSPQAKDLLGGGIPTRYNEDAIARFKALFSDDPADQHIAQQAIAQVKRRASRLRTLLIPIDRSVTIL